MKTLNQLIKKNHIIKSDLAKNNGISKQRLNGWLDMYANLDSTSQISIYQKVDGIYFDYDMSPVEANYKFFKTLIIPYVMHSAKL